MRSSLRSPRPLSAAPLLVLALLAAATAPSAQLEIPGQHGTKPSDEPVRTKDTKSVRRGDLDLPAGPRPPAGARDGAGTLDLPGSARSDEVATQSAPLVDARRLLDGLRQFSDLDSPAAHQALQSLALLGEPGRAACREALSSPHPVVLVTAARVLTTTGGPADRALVAGCLQRALPEGTAGTLLATLLDTDPVLGSPRFLVELLESSSGSMRTAAQRRLERGLRPEDLPLLATHLGSSRADTRLRCVELAGMQPSEPVAVRMLFDRLGDPSAKVACAAKNLLASGADDARVAELLQRSVGAPYPDRAAAYALLALVDREDSTDEILLKDEHVPALLAWLKEPEELVAGAAATALAGIGFRSEHSHEMAWLDRDVPHELVRLVSGAVFFADFTTLRDPALRRLGLLSGVAFGSDGPAWMRWWMGVAEGFHARRAVLAVDEAALPRLSVTWVDPSSPEDGVRALGPAAADAADPRQPVGRTFYISEAQCKTLADALRAEGVFGRERLPGHARLGRAKHVLDVSFGVEGKRFETSADPAEPWMQHVAAAIEDLARGSRWQLFHDRAKVGTQRAFWEAEHAWWDQPHTALERALREKEGVLACLESSDPSQRAEPLQELARLYDVTGVPAAADFPRLLALLAAERTAGDRASLVTSLALRAARGTAQDGGIAPELSAELQSALVVALGPAAESELERVLEAGGASGAVDAAHATEPVVRRAAARILAKRSDDAAHAELLRMIDDSDAGVEVEAIDALGAARVESARNEIFVRARLGAGTVRAAALRAVGRLGGDGAREALMLGLAEKDEAIQQAAVSGLAELRDPQSASLLVSIFARGAGTPLFEPARKGLFDLGQDAVPELLRLTASSAPATCREAALVLAREDVPRAAPVLMRILTDDPSDSAVAAELAVLTCVDERGQSDPASAWWSWWDLVVHDDSLAWLLGAAEGEGLSAPPAAAFAGKGTRAAADFLVDLLGVPKAHLQERARRELSRLLGRELQDPPAKPAALAAWRADLRAEVERVFGESSG